MALTVYHDADLRILVGDFNDVLQCMISLVPGASLDCPFGSNTEVTTIQHESISPRHPCLSRIPRLNRNLHINLRP